MSTALLHAGRCGRPPPCQLNIDAFVYMHADAAADGTEGYRSRTSFL